MKAKLTVAIDEQQGPAFGRTKPWQGPPAFQDERPACEGTVFDTARVLALPQQ